MLYKKKQKKLSGKYPKKTEKIIRKISQENILIENFNRVNLRSDAFR